MKPDNVDNKVDKRVTKMKELYKEKSCQWYKSRHACCHVQLKIKYKNGIHAMKDAAVTRKMVLENLASWFCRKLLRVRFLFSLQNKRQEKHVMSTNGVIKQIITMMSIFRCITQAKPCQCED